MRDFSRAARRVLAGMSLVLLVLLFAASTNACSAIIGIGDVPNPNAPGATPPPGNGTATGPDRFVGAWETKTGTMRITCDGASQDATIETTLSIARGTAHDLIATDSDNCTFGANVEGNVATLVPGQACDVQLDTLRVSYAVQSGTFELNAEGTAATLMMSGTLVKTSNQGRQNCTFATTQPYTKSSG